MEPWRQIESIGKSRWVGAYYQSHGLLTVPSMTWGQSASFRYCFSSIEKHCIVAVGMIGCKHNKISFLRGYDAMLEAIEPDAVICFGRPFPEMNGKLILADYSDSRRTIRDGR